MEEYASESVNEAVKKTTKTTVQSVILGSCALCSCYILSIMVCILFQFFAVSDIMEPKQAFLILSILFTILALTFIVGVFVLMCYTGPEEEIATGLISEYFKNIVSTFKTEIYVLVVLMCFTIVGFIICWVSMNNESNDKTKKVAWVWILVIVLALLCLFLYYSYKIYKNTQNIGDDLKAVGPQSRATRRHKWIL